MPRVPSRGIALSILLVLTAINFVNYLDRQVLAAVLEPLRLELGLRDTASGLLGGVFMGVYMVASPIGGQLGDRIPRKFITAVSVALWSLATVGSGLAEDYPTLVAMRAAVGVGEAGYAAVAPAVIADLFRPAERGRKLAYFYLAIPMGSAFGYLLGGWIGGLYGWRAAFFVAGAPGLLLAVVALLLPEPERGVMDDEPPGEPVPLRAAWRRVIRSPAWRFNTLGMALMTFTLGGLGYWMPAYLGRVFGLGTGEAGTWFGGVTVVAGLLGTLAGGWLGDRAQARHAGGYFSVSAWGLLLGAPFVVLLPLMPSVAAALSLVFFAEVLLFLNTGPLNAALVACVPASLRARAVAINVFFIHLLGDAFSPTLIGVISDRAHLGIAIGFMAIPVAVGGAVLWIGARRVTRLPGGLRAVDGEPTGDGGAAASDAPSSDEPAGDDELASDDARPPAR